MDRDLVEEIDVIASREQMEVSAEESKVMVNSSTNASADITMNGQKIEKVEAFKYLGATLTKNGRNQAQK